jgi:hypothetical protein
VAIYNRFFLVYLNRIKLSIPWLTNNITGINLRNKM